MLGHREMVRRYRKQLEDQEATAVPFDFCLDGWDPAAASLQATGDLILVRLPLGFYGGTVIATRDARTELEERLCRQRRQRAGCASREERLP